MTWLYSKDPVPVWQVQLTANSGGNEKFSNHVTTPYNGYYFAFARAKGGEYSPCWQLACEMHVGGGVYYEDYGDGAKPGHPQWDDSFVVVAMPLTFHARGDDCWFKAICAYDNGNEMIIAFCPTYEYSGRT